MTSGTVMYIKTDDGEQYAVDVKSMDINVETDHGHVTHREIDVEAREVVIGD